ncbi:MAG: hypothetical protein ABIJ09_20570 [Pseudomonadota bacterium]
MSSANTSRLVPVAVVLGAVCALAGTAFAAALVAEGQLGDWLLRMGWWSYPLRGLALVQLVISIVLGLRALKRPVPAWQFLILPDLSILVGVIGTWSGLRMGSQVLAAVALEQRLPIWAAVRAEAGLALVLAVLVAAQGCVGLTLASSLTAWQHRRRQQDSTTWPLALAVFTSSVFMCVALGLLLTSNFGDADVGRLAWLLLWVLGLGLALVPAALGSASLLTSSHDDERGAGLGLAVRAAYGAGLTVALHALALWQGHVASALSAMSAVDTSDSAELVARVQVGLARTLGSTSGAALAGAVLALVLVLPMAIKVRPTARQLRATEAALLLPGLPLLGVLMLGSSSNDRGTQAMSAVLERTPHDVDLPVLDSVEDLASQVPLVRLTTQGLRVDGDLTRKLPAAEPGEDGSCPWLQVAAPASLDMATLRPLARGLYETGACELALVVERPGAEQRSHHGTLPWPGIPSALRRDLDNLAQLRFERWGLIRVRLDPLPAAALTAVCRVELSGPQTSFTVDADSRHTPLRRIAGGEVDPAELQAIWRTSVQRGASCSALRVVTDEGTTLRALLSVVAATQVQRPTSDLGADPFGYDAAARLTSLFASVHWNP